MIILSGAYCIYGININIQCLACQTAGVFWKFCLVGVSSSAGNSSVRSDPSKKTVLLRDNFLSVQKVL